MSSTVSISPMLSLSDEALTEKPAGKTIRRRKIKNTKILKRFKDK